MKRSDKPKKDWVCTNCVHLKSKSDPQKNVRWECTHFHSSIDPVKVGACQWRDAGAPFEE